MDQKEPNCPLSPAESAKSMDKLNSWNPNILSWKDDSTPYEGSQQQFYIGAKKRQQIFTKTNEVCQPNDQYTEQNEISLQNLEVLQNQIQQNAKGNKNQLLTQNSIIQQLTGESQSPPIGWINSKSTQKKMNELGFPSNLKVSDCEMHQQDQSLSIFNNSEIKFNRFLKHFEDDLQLPKINSEITKQSSSKGINDFSIPLDTPDSVIERIERVNIYKKMRILNNVKKFITKMKRFASVNNYQLMRKQHFDLVHDVSCFDGENQAGSLTYSKKDVLFYFLQIKSIGELVIQRLPVINPENKWCILWDILFGIDLLIYFFVIPIEISFQVEFHFYRHYILANLLFNMVIQFCKGVYEKGALVMDQKQIMLTYIKGFFIFDILIMINIISRFQTWICFLKYTQLRRIIQRADDHFQIIRRFPIFYELTNLMVTLVLLGQIAGCGFHLVAQQELQVTPNSNTWLNILNLQNEEWTERYIASVYFAFITMITVGYGDIYPVTMVERVYVIVMTIFSSAVFGYVMNTIGTIFQNQAQLTASFKKRKQDVTNYLDFRNINRSLQIKVLKYIDYQEKIQKNQDLNYDLLFKEVPSNLTEEICQQYFGKYLLQNKIMKINFSQESIMALSTKMKERYLAPNEYLLKQGTRVSCVYFLIQGELDFLWERKDEITETIPLSTINFVGEALGMRCAFMNRKIKYSLRSSKNIASKLIYFEVDDFISIMQSFPEDYEKFCEIRDEIQFNKHLLDTKCQSCGRFNHIFEDCPLLFVKTKLIPVTLAKHTYPFKQERLSSKRKQGKFASLKKKDLVIDCVAQMKIQMYLEQYPEFVNNAADFYEMDINTLFGHIPAFIFSDGEYIPDNEEVENLDFELLLSQKSDSGQGETFLKQKQRKSLQVVDEQLSQYSMKQQNQIIQAPNDLESQTSLKMQTQSIIMDSQLVVPQQQHSTQQNKNNSKLFPVQNSDNMSIRQRKPSGSQVQMQMSDLSLIQSEYTNNNNNAPSSFQSNQVAYPNIIENNRNQMIVNLKRNESIKTRPKQYNSKTQAKQNQAQPNQFNINNNANIVSAMTERNYGRKITMKRNPTYQQDNNDFKAIQNNEKEDIVYSEFDKMKEYLKYYPRYNSKNIIERYNFIQKRIISKPKRQQNSRHHVVYGKSNKKQSVSNNIHTRQSQFLNTLNRFQPQK